MKLKRSREWWLARADKELDVPILAGRMTMPDSQLQNLLLRSKEEIQRLRQRNEVLEAVNRTVEVFGTALFSPTPSIGHEVDIVWQLQKAADELREKLADAAPS